MYAGSCSNVVASKQDGHVLAVSKLSDILLLFLQLLHKTFTDLSWEN